MEADHARSYSIWRAASGGGYIRVGVSTVPATGWDLGTSYTDTGLTNGSTYDYVLTSENAARRDRGPLDVQVIPNPKGSNKLPGTPIGSGGKLPRSRSTEI